MAKSLGSITSNKTFIMIAKVFSVIFCFFVLFFFWGGGHPFQHSRLWICSPLFLNLLSFVLPIVCGNPPPPLAELRQKQANLCGFKIASDWNAGDNSRFRKPLCSGAVAWRGGGRSTRGTRQSHQVWALHRQRLRDAIRVQIQGMFITLRNLQKSLSSILTWNRLKVSLRCLQCEQQMSFWNCIQACLRMNDG